MDQLPRVIIRISEEVKENAYKQHMDWLEANGRDRKTLFFYSDASLQPTTKQVKTGFYRQYAHNTKEYAWYLGNYMEVFNGGLFALTQAFKETATSLENFFFTDTRIALLDIYLFSLTVNPH